MGLKTTNYEVKNFGITLSQAYARLSNINVDINGDAFGVFEIHQTREDSLDAAKSAIQREGFNCVIDKDLPLHKQVYEKAKEKLFIDWEDDIVEN